MFYLRENNLLYYKKKLNQLCISIKLQKEVFDLIHDYIEHFRLNKAYIKLREHFFLSQTKLKLSKYILKCLTCQLIKSKNHKSYSCFNLISNFSELFEIYILDFITNLSENNSFNVILTITNKFT